MKSDDRKMWNEKNANRRRKILPARGSTTCNKCGESAYDLRGICPTCGATPSDPTREEIELSCKEIRKLRATEFIDDD